MAGRTDIVKIYRRVDHRGIVRFSLNEDGIGWTYKFICTTLMKRKTERIAFTVSVEKAFSTLKEEIELMHPEEMI